jgi:hypothetical protein
MVRKPGHTTKAIKSTSAIGEKKVLRKTFGPAQENGVRKIRTAQEVTDQCREPDITSISEIRIGILRRLKYVERMVEERIVKQNVFMNIPEGEMSVGKLRKI